MVNQGIVLGHIKSNKGIEVDKAKIKLISKLPSSHKCEDYEAIPWTCRFLLEVHQDLLEICQTSLQAAGKGCQICMG